MAAEEQQQQEVTPWEVSAVGGLDYDKLVAQFGCQPLDAALLARFERVLGGRPLHPLIRRGVFFAHRDLDVLLAAKEKGQPFYLYTGRGPSSEALHVGHLVPFMLIKWLQDVFDCPVVIQLTEDEKFLFKEHLSLAETYRLGAENAKDIIAVGFDPAKTFIFRNEDYIQQLYPVSLEIMKRTTFNQVKGIFGFNESTNIGAVSFPATQSAPAFAASFPLLFGRKEKTVCMRCLIPYAIDQDPYFRMCRDVAPRIGWNKPCSLISKFIPALQGAATKMSGSGAQTAIFVTDTPKEVKTKVNKYAFSGGQDTAEEQRQFGANIDVDVSYQYLRVFLEDDRELERIGEEYRTGKLLTGEVKAILIAQLTELIQGHQARRALVTDEVLAQFFNPDRPELRAKVEAACEAASLSASAAVSAAGERAPTKQKK